jgi:hypothetical protein
MVPEPFALPAEPVPANVVTTGATTTGAASTAVGASGRVAPSFAASTAEEEEE